MTRHLTYTGPYAGQLLCGMRRSEAPAADTYVHFTLASDAVINAPETCGTCRHVAFCEDDECETCKVHAVVYPTIFTNNQ